ncbi:hypothetical protein WJX81_002582 [Elliptochloris bilobata]|uniref:Uncharacterized protein n=1 Tax=Elliptochloris bilobata TaxID=381761 RepID=A0AAW1QDX9_9CHLO
MGPVEVRTLAGKITTLHLGDGDTGRTVKHLLRAQWGDSHRLMFRGSAVPDSTPIEALQIRAGEFVVALAVKKRPGQAQPAARAPVPTPPQFHTPPRSPASSLHVVSPAGGSPLPTGSANPSPVTSEGPFTLLPGYVSRPQPRRAAEGEGEAASGGGLLLLGGLAAILAEQQTSQVVAALVELPLPPPLQRLERVFAALNTVCAFLLTQHIQATWRSVRAAVRSLPGGQDAALADVEAMAALAPAVLLLRDRQRLPHDELMRHDEDAAANKREGEGESSGSEDAGIPDEAANPAGIRTDGAGTLLEGEHSRFVIELLDPGRRKTPAAASLEALGAEGLGSSQHAAAAKAAPAARAAKNAAARRVRAFRAGLARAVAALHAAWLARRAAAAASAEAEAAAAQPAASPGQQAAHAAQKAAGAIDPSTGPAAAPAPARAAAGRRAMVGAAAAAAGGERDWDPVARRAWHPEFPLAALTIPTLAAAVAEATAAVDEAREAERAKRRTAAQAAAKQRSGSGGDGKGSEPAAAEFAPSGVFADEGLGGDGAEKEGGLGGPREKGRGRGKGKGGGRGGGGFPRPPQLLRRHVPCTDTTPMDTQAFLAHLQELSWYKGQLVHSEPAPARRPRFADPAQPLSAASRAALASRGVGRLFIHQAHALDAVAAGRHTVVCTATASGKSLCYNLPVLEGLAAHPGATALYLFPTKALAQDQLRVLRELCAAAFGPAAPGVEVYDGDTPMDERPGARERARLLITNPDMLHRSFLPVHRQFGNFLAGLRHVIVDEGHYYRGVFGCHAALVLRRLRRLCDREYRSHPVFVVTSATIANPKQHVRNLLGVPEVTVVSEDGSPHGPKTFVLWNPPLTMGQSPKGALAPLAAVTSDGRFNLKHMSHTEGRVRARMNKRAKHEVLRAELQEAAQARGAGVKLGANSGASADALPGDKWLEEVRLGRRRATVAGVALAALEGRNPLEADLAVWRDTTLVALSRQLGQRAVASAVIERPMGSKPGSYSRTYAVGAAPPATQMTMDGPPRPLLLRGTAAAGLGFAGGASAPGAAGRAPVEGSTSAKAPSGRGRNSGRASNGGGVRGGGGGGRSDGRGRGGGRGDRGGAADAAAGESQEELQARREAQARLPGPEWRERHGAAGVPAGERRSSPIVEISLLLAECVQHGLRTIAFCHTRKLCELVIAYTRETLRSTAPTLAPAIAVYRAGYSPKERREVEAALFGGTLMGVAATNALELGIDVGSLDVTLHLGFPGSVSSLLQQAGRAGRREQPSASIYVAFDGPTDQYFFRHPEQLFGRPVEKAQIDAQNQQLMGQHLACAALELPLLLEADQAYFGPRLPAVAGQLRDAGLLNRHPHMPPDVNALLYTGAHENPAAGFSLRAIDPERYQIVNEAAGGAVIEEIEESKAFFEVYDGAVYLYQGRTYLCKKLDLAARVAVVRPADLKYYTKTRDFTDVHVLGLRAAYEHNGTAGASDKATTAAVGDCLVTTRWLGFHRIWQGSGEVFDTVDLFLPDMQLRTQAAYIRVPASARAALRARNLPFRDGLHAASHALLNVLPLRLMCGALDMGTECDNPYDTRFRPERLLVFDKHPGGIGLAQQAHAVFGELLELALELVHSCNCAGMWGCPACVQHSGCGEYNAVLHKEAAVAILELTLAAQAEFRERARLQRAHGALQEEGRVEHAGAETPV